MLYSSNILFMPLLELSSTKKNQQTSESYALPSETSMVVERENSLNLSNFFIFMRRLSIWRSWGGVFGRAGEFLHVTPFRYCEPFYIPAIASSSLPFIANRRVGKCSGVKQSPRCTFLLVLGVLRRLLRLIVIRLAMTRRWLGNGNFSQVNKEKKLKKNKIINQQKLNAHGN